MEDAFGPQLNHIASLRSELRALRGAIDGQYQRMAHHDRVMDETAQIRSELASLNTSLDSRRRALSAIRSSQEDVDALAEQVARAASDTTATLQRDREREQRHSPLPAAATQPAPSRDAMLEAARERMRRRGVGPLSGDLGGTSIGGGRGGREASMFDRLRHVRDAEERVAAAAAAAIQGEPKVEAVTLIRPIKDVCSICLEPRKAGDAVWILQCGHCFHQQCCRKWLSGASTCPMCKKEVERAPVAGDCGPKT